jgi:hypothetical protein
MLLNQITAVYSDRHTKPTINCSQNAELLVLIIKTGGTYNNHWVLNTFPFNRGNFTFVFIL